MPTVTAESATTFCDGDTVTLTSSTGTDYLWSNGETTQSINITASGTYTVRAINASGCLSAASLAIVVSVTALPLISASNNGPVCAGSALNLTGGPAGMAIYYWTGPDDSHHYAKSIGIGQCHLRYGRVYTLTVPMPMVV